ncbi:MAG: hypothetical protein QXH30_01425 [Candidatus Bilamarchaeaceae archaeon]
MFGAMKGALEAFSRNPLSFLIPTIAYPIFMTITVGAMAGVVLLEFLLLTALSIQADIVLIALAATGALLLIFYGLFSAGYKGALVNEYRKALRREPVGFTYFMKYAFKNCPGYFTISLVKIVVMGFLITPLSLFYYFMDLGVTNELLAWLVILLALSIVFVVEFLFSFSYIAAAVKGARPLTAVINSLNFIKETHVEALIVYAFYCAVVLASLVPLVNLVAYVLFYPVAYSTLIQFFEKKSKYGPY